MTTKKAWLCCIFFAVAFMFNAGEGNAQSNSNEFSALRLSQNPKAQEEMVAVEQNSSDGDHCGQHDFDFELGTWKIHLKRLLHPP